MKLTIHDACWDAQASDWANKALAAKVRWIKVIDDPVRAFGVAQAAPACGVIYRKVAPSDIEQLSDLRRHPEFRDARACAEMFVRLCDVRQADNLWIEGANEIKLGSLDDALWYGQVEALRARILAGRNLKAVIGNFATGNPEGGLFRAWLQSYLDNSGPRDALIGIHEYGTLSLPAARDQHNLLRHRLLAKEAGQLVAGFRWAITECGLDRVQVGGQWVGGGWRAPGAGISEATYWQFMADFERELERDADVVCACVFTYGDTARWRDYEMNDAKEFNNNLVAAIVADPKPAAPKPDCGRTDVPADWTHLVEATKGLNVRSTPVIADNILCAMVNGKQVRALSRQGDWMRIDWPVAGWCWAPNLKPRPATQPVERKLGDKLDLNPGARFVDVSAWQTPEDLDWKVFAWNGCEAAMIRLAAGTLTDPEWHLYAAGAAAAGVPWFGYIYYSFTVSWQTQITALGAAIAKMAKLPTIALDLEGQNPTKADADLRQYIAAVRLIGAPLALYTRQSWVNENLPHLRQLLPDVPLIVANYRYPIDAAPALPTGWERAEAWQHVAGEKVESDKLYWARFKTRSGKYLDESVVMEGGLTVHVGA